MWATTLTTGSEPSGDAGYHSTASPPYGSLTDNTFVYGGTTFTVRRLVAASSEVIFEVDTAGLPTNDTLTLEVANSSTSGNWVMPFSGRGSGSTTTKWEFAPSSSTQPYFDFFTFGHVGTVCLRTSTQTCPTASYGSAADSTAPTLSTATVDGTALVLTYNEALDGSSEPAGSAYTVVAGGATVTVSTVTVAGMTATLTLSSAVSAGQTVTVSYTKPGTNPLKDAAGNEAGALTGEAVTNNTGVADTTLSALELSAGGAALTLSPSFASATRSYTTQVLSTVGTVTVEPTTTHPMATVSYLSSSNSALSDADSMAAGYQVAVPGAGNPFKVRVTPANGGATGDYTIRVNRAPSFTASSASLTVAENVATNQDLGTAFTASDADGDTVGYALTGTVASAFSLRTASGSAYLRAVSLNYETRASHVLTVTASDGRGGSAESALTVTVTDVSEPPSAPSAPSVSAKTGTSDTLSVSWTAPANTGPAITDYDVRWCKGSASDCTADGDFTDFGHTGTATTAEVTGLTAAAAEHQVQVRATNAEGTGAWSASGAGTTGVPMLTVRFTGAVADRQTLVVEGGTLSVPVTLSGAPGREVVIPLNVSRPGGTSASDYSVSTRSLTFGAAETEKTVTLTAVDDTSAEGREGVLLQFAFGVLPLGIMKASSGDFVNMGIVDNDFSYEVNYVTQPNRTYNVGEAAGTLALTVVVETPSAPAVTSPFLREHLDVLNETVEVSLASVDGTAMAGQDYTALSGVTLTFSASDFVDQSGSNCGCAQATTTVEVTITDDVVHEPGAAERFTLRLSHDASTQRVVYVPSSGGETVTVIITDDDAAPMPVLTADASTVNESGSDLAVDLTVGMLETRYASAKGLTLELSGSATESTSSTPADYSVSSKALTIPAGSSADVSAGTVTVRNDLEDEDPEEETIVVTLKDGATALSSVTITVVDDDDPPVSVSYGAAAYTAEEGDVAEVTVRLDDDPERTVVVPLTATPGGAADSDGLADYTLSGMTVTFAASTVSTDWVRTVTVTVEDDAIDDDGETVVLGFGTLPDSRVSAGTPSASTVSLTDNDMRGLVLRDDFGDVFDVPPELKIDEEDVNVTEIYTVELMTQPTAAVTVTLSVTGDQQDGLETVPSVSPGSLTFTPSNWSTAQSVTVTVPADADGVDEGATIGHVASGGDYGMSEGRQVAVTVSDDEDEPMEVALSVSPSEVTEGTPEDVEVTGTLDTAARKVETVLTVSVLPGVATEASDYAAVPDFTLTIAAQALSGTATFQLSAAADLLYETETETVSVSAPVPTVLSWELPLTVTGTSVELVSNDAEPVLSFATNRTEIPENGGRARLTLRITNGVGFERNQRAGISFAGTTARRGGDYTPGFSDSDGTYLALDGGVVSASTAMNVTANDDTEDEDDGLADGSDDEFVRVTVRFGGSVVSTPQQVAILDDDDPVVTVSFSQAQYTASEGGTPASVAVEISANPERTLVVPLTQEIRAGAVAGNASSSDYSGVPASVTFTASSHAAQRFTVTATDDDVDDDGESVALAFGTVTDDQGQNGSPNRVQGLSGMATVSLVDDDERGLVFDPAALRVSDQGPGAAAGLRGDYTLRLTSEPTSAVTVALDTSDELIFRVRMGSADVSSLTFTASDWSTSRTLRLEPLADEDAVNTVVRLGHTMASGGDYGSLAPVDYTVTIVDTDTAATGLTLSATPSRMSEAGRARAVRVRATLDGAATAMATTVSVSVSAGTAGPSDYAASPSSLTIVIPGTEASAQGTFTLTPVNDAEDEEDETVTLSGTAATGTGTLTVTSVAVTLTDDDTRGVTVSESLLELAEGETATYTVVLDSAPTGAVTVAVTAGDAAVSAAPGELVFDGTDWSTERAVTVTAVQDTDASNERVALAHAVSGADYGANGVTATTVQVRVDDDEEGSSRVLLELSRATVLESAGAVDVTVTAQLDGGALPSATAVSVEVGGGTASGSDYAAPSLLTVSIPAGALSGTVTFRFEPTDDGEDEFDETVLVTGTSPSGLSVVVATLTIEDDDTRGVTVTPTTLDLDEGTSGQYTVALDSAPTGAVTVRLSLTGPAAAGVRVSAESLVFTASAHAAKTVVVQARGDRDEAGGTVTVAHAVTGADYGAAGVTAPPVTVTVTDTGIVEWDVELSVDDASPLAEGGGARALEVTAALLTGRRTAAVPVTVTVSGDTASASDFRARPASFTLTIPAGQEEVSRQVMLEPIDDGIDEGDETLVVVPTVAAELTTNEEGVALTIVDDDTRGVAVRPSALTLVEGAQGSYTVSLGSQPTASVTVSVTLSGSVSVTASRSSLVFTASNWRRAQGVTVRSAQDRDPDDETVTVTHAVSGGDYGDEMAAGVSVTVEDDDKPSTKVKLSAPAVTVAEGGGSRAVTMTGRLDGTPEEQDVEVTLSAGGGTASPGTDYAAPEAVLTIAAGQTEARAVFTVTPVDDGVDEEDETLVVSGRLSSSQALSVEPAAGLTVTIADDDTRGVSVRPTALTVAEGAGGTYVVALGSAPAGGDVTVTVSGHAGSDLTVSPETLTFTASDYGAKTVTVTAPDDADVEDDARLELAHAVAGTDYGANSVEAAAVTVTVPGFELTADGAGVRLRVSSVGTAAVPSGTLAPAGLRLVLPVAHAGTTVEVRTTSAPGEAPRGFRLGDTVADIDGVTLGAGETAQVCLPTADDGEVSVQRWDEMAMAWVALDEPSGGSSPGRVCGVTEEFSVFAVMVELEEPEMVFSVETLRVEIGEEDGVGYTVVLAARPEGAVTVTVTATGAAAAMLAVSPAQLVFTEADWAQARTVTAAAAEMAERGEASLLHEASGGRYLTPWSAELPVAVAEDTGLLTRAYKAWLARFGRTAAGHVAEAVGARVAAPPAQEAELSLGGAAAQDALLSGALQALAGESRPDRRRMLADSSFVLPLGSDGERRWTAWGRGAYTEFDGEDGELKIDGEVRTGTVGVDWEQGGWRLGVALSHSEGEGDIREKDGERVDLESTLTGAHPYARYETEGGLVAWGVLGYGTGELEREQDGERTETDIEMRMAAFGLRGSLGTYERARGAFELSLKSDVLAVRMEADADAELPEVTADAQRVRLLLEGAGHCQLESGGVVAPVLEAGLRFDEGDAETGLGVEVGAGLRYADASGRLSAELSARGLLAHEESGYDEWGVGGSLSLEPDSAGRGLSLRLGSSYGTTASGTEALWTRRDVAGLAPDQDAVPGMRFGAELGYGLNAVDGRGILTPYAGFERQAAESAWRLGSRLALGEDLDLGVEGAWKRRAGEDDEHHLQFVVSGRW